MLKRLCVHLACCIASCLPLKVECELIACGVVLHVEVGVVDCDGEERGEIAVRCRHVAIGKREGEQVRIDLCVYSYCGRDVDKRVEHGIEFVEHVLICESNVKASEDKWSTLGANV